MSGSCHFGQDVECEIGAECQIFVIDTFLTADHFYNLGQIQGIIRLH